MATANQLPPFTLPNTLNLPQPDFDLIEQGAKELGKIRNLPAFAQGQAILDAINQVCAHVDTKLNQFNQLDARITQLDTQFTQINTQLNQLNTRVAQLDTRVTQNHNIVTQNHNNVTQQITQLNQDMTQGFADLRVGLAATEHNTVARVANSHVDRSNVPLMALHDLATGVPIPGFPGTIAQITAMQGADVNNLLMALNLPVNGTVPERRQRLRLHIGLLAETA